MHVLHGPYRVLEITNSDASVVPVDKPQSAPIFVALSRLCHYPAEIPEEAWLQVRKKPDTLAVDVPEDPTTLESPPVGEGLAKTAG